MKLKQNNNFACGMLVSGRKSVFGEVTLIVFIGISLKNIFAL